MTIPPNQTVQQRPSSSDGNEWQDIRELLVFSSSAGLKSVGSSGSSDPGSPNSAGGVREKKSSGGSGILPRFLHNSSFRGDKSSSNQLRPPGSAAKTSPVQIQLHLLPGCNPDDKNVLQKPRRHSLERYTFKVLTRFMCFLKSRSNYLATMTLYGKLLYRMISRLQLVHGRDLT